MPQNAQNKFVLIKEEIVVKVISNVEGTGSKFNAIVDLDSKQTSFRVNCDRKFIFPLLNRIIVQL